MKIKGQTGFTAPMEEYEIIPPSESGEGLTVCVSALRSTFVELLQRRLAEPRAPENLIPKSGGGYVMDPKTKRPMRAPDESDPAYKAELLTHNILTMVAAFFHGTKDGGDVSFDAVEPEGERPEDWRRFYSSIREEMDASGLTLGAVGGAVSGIMRLSGLDADKMKEDAGDFS